MKNRKRNLFFVALLIGCIQSSFAQEASFNGIGQKFNTYRSQAQQEKLFVHLDRSFYYSGETMWFKVYAVDGTLHKPLDISAVAYLEIVDLTNHAVLQTKIALHNGAGDGSLFLPSSLSTGNYLLRAYTRWMKNFDPDFYFQQSFSILNTLRKPDVASEPESPAFDIQFFPEGGNLVKGIKSKIAFRAIDKNGNGIGFRGAIVNVSNDTIVKFSPTKFGIGNFVFTPTESQGYKAVIKVANGKVTSHQLPAINDSGYVISLTDSSNFIRLATFAKLSESTSGVVYLLVHARNQIAVSVAGRLVQGKAVFPIDKKLLGDGINHLTIFNDEGKPVCERLYFKKPENSLVVTAASDKQQYDRRRKVIITLDAKSTNGKELPADFSLAVYRKDSLQTIQPTSISQYLWLTSELRG
ncbi:MAG TPA: hypothetical protein VFE57_01310, partial [Cyclobacteriaceae bacterium]|nr:hypothetical protein [Cyclobacteriaceae bacterium]